MKPQTDSDCTAVCVVVTSVAAMSDGRDTGVGSWLPGLKMVRGYRWSYVRSDVQAGLILSALLVPAGMAYAEASGLPPIYGLYATVVPLTAYAIFGPSRILVLGPDSSLSPLIAAALLPLAAGDSARAVALAGALGIFVGLMLIATGLARLGFITELLSKPVRYGFVNGIALTVLVSQVPNVLGFSVESTNLVGRVVEIAQGVAAGLTNPTSLALGLGSLALILVLKRWAPRVPGILLAVILATVAVGVFGLVEQGIAVVGPVPRGLPSLVFPRCGGRTWDFFWWAPPASPWWPSPTPASSLAPSPPAPGTRWILTGRWSRSASRTPSPGSSRDSLSAAALPARRLPSRREPRPKSPDWSARWRSPAFLSSRRPC